ncbi:MAG: hypothetical protein IJO41_05410 [Oscillospiraceae bacterium]|nr:hypothetical protein [Oscillospiraceae bacterium]MBQ9837415.1 hypothetical protein [Oscillospiraceae bacterium]
MVLAVTNKKAIENLKAMTMMEVWEKHWPEIADLGKWQCNPKGCSVAHRNACFGSCQNVSHRAKACGSIISYGEYIRQICEFLPMPIGQITPQDITLALARLQEKGGAKCVPYSESTIGIVVHAAKSVLRYADPSGPLLAFLDGRKTPLLSNETRSNPRKRRPYPKAELYKVRGNKNIEAIKKQGKDFLIKFKKHPKAKAFSETLKERRGLTVEQDERLIARLMTDLLIDSRAIGLIIIRYTGIRPGELLYLRWKHLKFFTDKNGRTYLVIRDTVDRNGKPKKRGKTPNSIRPIPVHGELQIIIDKYCSFLRETYGEDIGNLPICRNNLQSDQPCKYNQLVNYAALVLREVLDDASMLPYVRSFLADMESGVYKGRGENIRLYLLRKAFYTSLLAQAQLDANDKYYIMGHAVRGGHKGKRGPLDKKYLKDLMAAMDNVVVSAALHRQLVTYKIANAGFFQLINKGSSLLAFDLEKLPESFEVEITMVSEEFGGELGISIPHWLKEYVEFEANSFVKKESPHQGINTEFSNFMAHKRCLKENSETPVTERSNDSGAGVF